MSDFEVSVEMKKFYKIREEAHYHHTLLDFGEVLRQYGVEKVMADLDEDSYWILEKWFVRGEVRDPVLTKGEVK